MKTLFILLAGLSLQALAQTEDYNKIETQHLNLSKHDVQNNKMINDFLNTRYGKLQGKPVLSRAQNCFHKDKRGKHFTHDNYVYLYCGRKQDRKDKFYYKKVLVINNGAGSPIAMKISSENYDTMEEATLGQNDGADIILSGKNRGNTRHNKENSLGHDSSQPVNKASSVDNN